MPVSHSKYGPPETDSEDEYDGFWFGDNFEKSPTNYIPTTDRTLYEAAIYGNLDDIKDQIRLSNFRIEDPINDGFTLLLHACKEGHYNVVQYLVEELHANVNRQIDSTTPLMMACDSNAKEPHIIEKIIKLLLKHDALINVSDKYGTTPLMLACKNGHVAAVRHIIGNASLNAIDNHGNTALILAIGRNHAEIVKMLIDAGADCQLANGKGYTPVQVAHFYGFYDLLDLLPKEKETYDVPSHYLCYNTLRDYIPRIFLKSDCPEYFPEINYILNSIDMGRFLEYFAKGNISLAQFLSINDDGLKKIGIEMPIHRAKILKGLLDFHLHHWAKKSIARVNKTSSENFYEILMITANHLQHLVIISATLRYIRNNLESKVFGNLTQHQLETMKRNINAYRNTIEDHKKTVEYLASFSPKRNPLYIDYDEYIAKKKRDKYHAYFKYTTIVIGISVFIGLKIKNFF